MSQNVADPVIQYESQQQRWIKYGANVALSVIVAIVLVALLVYLAEKKNHRTDMTAEGNYSLKPQTSKHHR